MVFCDRVDQVEAKESLKESHESWFERPNGNDPLYRISIVKFMLIVWDKPDQQEVKESLKESLESRFKPWKSEYLNNQKNSNRFPKGLRSILNLQTWRNTRKNLQESPKDE